MVLLRFLLPVALLLLVASLQAAAHAEEDASSPDALSHSALIQITPSTSTNVTIIGLYGLFSTKTAFGGIVRYAKQPSDNSLHFGCDVAEYEQPPQGQTWVAVALRGNCTFVEKTAKAQAAGAAGILIVNDVGGDFLVAMSGVANDSLTIPAVSISSDDGSRLTNLVRFDNSTLLRVIASDTDASLWGSMIYQHALSFFAIIAVMVALSFFVYYLKGREHISATASSSNLAAQREVAIHEAINKLEKISFSDDFGSQSEASSQETCAICLTSYTADMEITKLPCNHCFHTECVTQWLERNPTCPLCKRSILDEVHIDINTNTTTNTGTASESTLMEEVNPMESESHSSAIGEHLEDVYMHGEDVDMQNHESNNSINNIITSSERDQLQEMNMVLEEDRANPYLYHSDGMSTDSDSSSSSMDSLESISSSDDAFSQATVRQGSAFDTDAADHTIVRMSSQSQFFSKYSLDISIFEK